MNSQTKTFSLIYSYFLINLALGDVEIKDMYSPVILGDNRIESYINYVIELNPNDKADPYANSDIQDKITMRSLILDELGKFPGALSLHESADGNRSFGLFFNTQLHGQFPPFFRVFGGGDIKIGGDLRKRSMLLGDNINLVGEYRAKILNQLKLKVLDLNDAYVEVDDMIALSRVESLSYLAMSSRGMRYDKEFTFPENITHLVVKNAELTPHFFQAIKTIKNLKSLTIERCYIRGNYNWPSLAERNYLLDPSVKIPSSNNPFENITKNLKELTIRQSDPVLFEYFNLLTWPKLSGLTVDIFMDSDLFRLNLSRDDQDFRKRFPSLKKVNLSLHDTKLSENLVNIIKTRYIKGLVIQIE